MTSIDDFSTADKTVTVDAGCTLQRVQEFALAHQLLFPVDIGARGSCTIGGNIATNAGGMEVLRYGMMRHQVLGLEVVLADGTLISALNRMKKNNTGQDLKQLFIGSEGILGVVTRAVLQLQPLPAGCESALIACDSFTGIIDLLDSAQRALGDTLTRFEVMDGEFYRAQTVPGGHRPPLEREHSWYALVEIRGYRPVEDRQQFEDWLAGLLDSNIATAIVVADNQRQREGLWSIRENFDTAMASAAFALYDVSLPIAAMAAYLDRLHQALRRRWPDSLCYAVGHLADGNLHFFIAPEPDSGRDAKGRADDLVYGLLADEGGSVSAEHGIGIDKKPWLGHSRTPAEIALMKTLKAALDPGNILNPGRIFDF
jgi:FAD/FMN-containing dehydrogenase